ncbi:MAG: hypothetical protein IJ186_03100 [Bacilli bacterium]|nr:hypothetical protein [Bacilli bacterium]
MGLFKKAKKENTEFKSNVSKTDIKKLFMFITIVNRGQGNFVLKLFESEGANAQFVQYGEGTAQKEIRDILGIEDNSKEIIISLISQDKIDSAKRELEAFFKVSKRNRGIGFSIPMTSLIGMKFYQFLIDTL